MKFGDAIEHLKAGKRVARRAFDSHAYVYLNPDPQAVDKVLMHIRTIKGPYGQDLTDVRYRCVHADFLADDWELA